MAGKLLHLIGHICYTLLIFCYMEDLYIINAHDLLMNDLNPPPSFEQANVLIFLVTYQAFTINFKRSHDIEDFKQEKMQLNMNLVLKEG